MLLFLFLLLLLMPKSPSPVAPSGRIVYNKTTQAIEKMLGLLYLCLILKIPLYETGGEATDETHCKTKPCMRDQLSYHDKDDSYDNRESKVDNLLGHFMHLHFRFDFLNP